MPGASSSDTPRESQAKFRDGTVCARGVSIRGTFVLSRNPGYKTMGIAMWLNVVPTHRVAYLKSKFRYAGRSKSFGYCCSLCPTGGQYSGKFVLSSPSE